MSHGIIVPRWKDPLTRSLNAMRWVLRCSAYTAVQLQDSLMFCRCRDKFEGLRTRATRAGTGDDYHRRVGSSRRRDIQVVQIMTVVPDTPVMRHLSGGEMKKEWRAAETREIEQVLRIE